MTDETLEVQENGTLEETVEAPAEQVALPNQVLPFTPVVETKRTYVFPGNEKLEVPYVYAIHVKPDGTHKLLTRSNPKRGVTVASGWISVIHEAEDDSVAGYVFTE